MRRLITLALGLSLGAACHGQSVPDPVADYAEFHALGRDPIYKLEVDLNNDGKPEILLDTKANAQEAAAPEGDRVDPNIRFFSVYIAQPDGATYVKSRGIDEGQGIVNGMVAEIDISHYFVGFIDEWQTFGGVTAITSTSDDGTSHRRLVAYRVVADHLVSGTLAQYRADARNALYDKYFSRTEPLDVKEVSVPSPSPTLSPTLPKVGASPDISKSQTTPTPPAASSTASSTPATSSTPTPSSEQNSMPLAMKVMLGLVSTIVVVFVALTFMKRRGRPR